MNALRTGAFARTPLLPGEEAEELREFIDEMVDDLAPATAAERDLPERVAGLSWRRRRLWRAEEEVIAEEFGDMVEPDGERERYSTEQDPQVAELSRRLDGQKFMAEQFTGKEPGALVRIAEHERRLAGSIDAALRMLMKVQDHRLKHEREAENGVGDATFSGTNEPTARLTRRATSHHAAAQNEAIEDKTPATNEPTARSARCLVSRHAPAQNEANAQDEVLATNEPTGDAAPSMAAAQNEAISAKRVPLADVDWNAVVAAAATAVTTGRGGQYGLGELVGRKPMSGRHGVGAIGALPAFTSSPPVPLRSR